MSQHDQYDNPQAVLNDTKLTQDEKINILTEWLDHEKQKLVADEENMPQSDESDANGELVPKLVAALRSLGVTLGD